MLKSCDFLCKLTKSVRKIGNFLLSLKEKNLLTAAKAPLCIVGKLLINFSSSDTFMTNFPTNITNIRVLLRNDAFFIYALLGKFPFEKCRQREAGLQKQGDYLCLIWLTQIQIRFLVQFLLCSWNRFGDLHKRAISLDCVIFIDNNYVKCHNVSHLRPLD